MADDRDVTADIARETAAGPLFGPKDAIEDNTGRYVVTESMNIFDKIVCDHRKVAAMYDTYRSPSTTLEQQQLLGWLITMELSCHAAKEEMVLYPVVRQTLGNDAANHLIAEHQTTKMMLAQLDVMAVTDPMYDETLRGAVETMLGHINEEENNFLPRLAARLTPAAQLHMGILFAAAIVRAPTRPHPEAAVVPPLNETVYAAAKLTDTALDQARFPSFTSAVMGAVVPAPAGDTDMGAATPGGAGQGAGGGGGTAEGTT